MCTSVPDNDFPVAWVVDVDGTLALNSHRSPHDWRRADYDIPNTAVIMVVQALARHPNAPAIIAISGRQEQAREITTKWLLSNDVPFDDLIMRRNGDYRADDLVKEELFRQQIQPYYSVAGVLDDRDRVVKMWRRLGLVCLQVADGAF